MAMYYGDSNGKAQRIVVTGMQGPAGPQGPQGEPGPQGPAGQGVPAGGTAGQVLTQSNDGPVWETPLSGLGELVETLDWINVYKNGNLITLIANQSKIFTNTFTDGNGSQESNSTGLTTQYKPVGYFTCNCIRIDTILQGTIVVIGTVLNGSGSIVIKALYIGKEEGQFSSYVNVKPGNIISQYYLTE